MKDDRVVYGARCTWWDLIDNVGRLPNGLPCCPHCGSVLYEFESLDAWWQSVDRAIKDKRVDADYSDFIEWLQGRCNPGRSVMDAYRAWQWRADQP